MNRKEITISDTTTELLNKICQAKDIKAATYIKAALVEALLTDKIKLNLD